jgi:hypothetical protein
MGVNDRISPDSSLAEDGDIGALCAKAEMDLPCVVDNSHTWCHDPVSVTSQAREPKVSSGWEWLGGSYSNVNGGLGVMGVLRLWY